MTSPLSSTLLARNLVLSVTILRWGWSALRIGVQLFKSWCQKRVWIVGKRRNKEPVARSVSSHAHSSSPLMS